jgi:uncharacterized repeat protein (TIGR03803 family)
MTNSRIVLSKIAHSQRLKSFRTSAAIILATLMLMVAATPMVATAQTFKTLHSFDGTDGEGPYAGLVQGTDGNLYGTTKTGGADTKDCGVLGCGTAFKISPTGTLTTLHSFDGTGGQDPVGALVQATNGNFYGTTEFGGANSYHGTVFKITSSGRLTTLYSFCSQINCMDGGYPYAGLVQATNGNFYGTTEYGGANHYYGTVFKITPSGTLTTLYSFCSQNNCIDGEGPYAGLVQATNGNFYGTTVFGGANNLGTVFEITPGGRLTTLHSFDGGDGEYPYGGLVQATDGNFYGTTEEGGNGFGTIFKITPSGGLTTLHTFDGEDGEYSYGGLVQATDGNFYGTTSGGTYNYGTVFKITLSGTLTTLYSFCSQNNCIDGEGPYAGLVQATNGNFYGTTFAGGASSACPGACGTVFSLSVCLGPFVETQPTSGKVGASVKILGTNLTRATSVSFNGTAAGFKVVSSSEIATTVPTGATTGKVKVTTPHGTLSSNKIFRVRTH